MYKECDQRTVYRLLRTSDRVSDIMYKGFCTDYDQESVGSGLHIRDSRALRYVRHTYCVFSKATTFCLFSVSGMRNYVTAT